MVQLQATQTILNMAGYGTVNSNVELDKAKVRKANAEADIAEAKSKMLDDQETGAVNINITPFGDDDDGC